MESKHNANSDQQPLPAEIAEIPLPAEIAEIPLPAEVQPPAASEVKMCAYEFLSAAVRESLPTCWSNGVGKDASITLDSPTSPRYNTGAINHRHYLEGIGYREGSVRTEIRIPAKLAAYYYEVTIVNEGPYKCIAIGFGRNRKNMDGLPGWQASDRAFHFDDGCFFYGHYKKGEQYHNGCPIEAGAVYGCGVDFRINQMFFTRNGVIIALEPPMRKMLYGQGHLYPFVGLGGLNTQLDTNFGQKPFMFDLKSYYKKGYLNMPTKPIKKRQSMPAENPGPSKTPRRNLSVTLPNLDESLDADDSDHVPGERSDVKPRVRISLENAEQIETERDVTLAENEHSQTNAMSNVADNTDPNLPHCEPDEVRAAKPEILEADESNGPSDGFDINEVLDLISRGHAREAEGKIIASEFGPIYESKPKLVLFLKIEVLIELWSGNDETEEDERKIRLLGKSIASLAHGISNLGARIQKKVEDSLLLSYAAINQELEQHKYLLRPDEHQKVAELIEMAFTAYKAEKDYDNLLMKSF